MSENTKVVIVGGVACGPKAAARIKRLMPGADVTMIEKGKLVSYGACGMPYYVSGEVERLEALMETPVGVQRTAGFFKNCKGFETLTESEVVAIRREEKVVEVVDLPTGRKSTLPYDKLILATGTRPFVPPIPGLELQGIAKMYHPDDAATVRQCVENKEIRRAVIVGAGLIGLEMAEAYRANGIEVTIVEMLGWVMGQLVDEEIGRLAMKHLAEKGVELRMEERVEAFLDDGQGRLKGVKTSGGTIEADHALVSIGVRPRNELAIQAGLALDAGGAILINTYCQTNDPDIYAGGDCVSNTCLEGVSSSRLFAPLGSTANKHGRVIANHIAGRPEAFPGVLGTAICRAFDITLARTGLNETQARRLGYDVETVLWAGADLPHFLPEHRAFCIKLVMDRRTRRLLGFQGVGQGTVDKRLDVAATAISFHADIDDMAFLDLGYAPPFSPPLDPMLTAVHVAQNKLDGIARSFSALELRSRLENGDTDVVLLDVRSPGEREVVRLPYEDRTVHIPLGALRGRLEELPRDKPIIAFCKISLRGYEAERILSQAGFTDVAYLEGGIAGWPFETVVPG